MQSLAKTSRDQRRMTCWLLYRPLSRLEGGPGLLWRQPAVTRLRVGFSSLSCSTSDVCRPRSHHTTPHHWDILVLSTGYALLSTLSCCNPAENHKEIRKLFFFLILKHKMEVRPQTVLDCTTVCQSELFAFLEVKFLQVIKIVNG